MNAITLWQREARYPEAPAEDYDARRWSVLTELDLEALDVEGEITVANWCLPYKTQRTRGGTAHLVEMEATAARGAVQVKGLFSRLACVSSYDPRRDESRSVVAIDWALETPGWTAELDIGRDGRRFPHDLERDQLGLDRSLEIEFTTAMADVSLLWVLDDTDRPNKPALTKRFRRLRGTFKRGLLGWDLSLRLSQDTTRYPNDPTRTKHVHEALGKAEKELPPWTLSASFENEETIFPHHPVKDKLFRKSALSVEWTWDPVGLALAFALEARDTRFPNDPLKDVGQLRAEFELAVEPWQDVSVSLQGGWVRERFPNDPEKDTTTASLSLTVALGF